MPDLDYQATFGGFTSVLRADRRRVDPATSTIGFGDKTQTLVRSFGHDHKHLQPEPEPLPRASLALPPLDEQRRIAAILDKADALRQKRKRAIALLDSLTQSIFLEMFGASVSKHAVADLLADGSILINKDGNHGSRFPRAEEFAATGVPFISAKSVNGEAR